MQADVIRFAHKFIEADTGNAVGEKLFLGNERIIGDHLHFQGQRLGRHNPADMAVADNAEHLAAQFHAHEAGALPFTLFHGPVGLGQVPTQGKQVGQGQFRRGSHVGVRGVEHDDAFTRGMVNVYIIDADAGPADYFEPVSRVNDFCRNRCGAAYDDGMIVANLFAQRAFIKAGDMLCGNIFLSVKESLAFRRDLVRYQNTFLPDISIH